MKTKTKRHFHLIVCIVLSISLLVSGCDSSAKTDALIGTGVGALIHLYSIGYMHGDENFSKFFLYLNLFAFSMLMLVLGDNMLLTFLGWEGVGACSYFLISFWFTDEANATAGKKAFVTNRVGDWGFMIAMFLLFTTIGSIDYVDIFGNASELSEGTATAIVVLLFVGAAGKSAQFPLYLWLPDAMAGPTPVSALIHAATMVTSGVYLLTRVNPIIAESAAWAPTMIAWIGVGTALFAATIAVAQNDIKKVLAYSTVSQLGYMFLAVGTGAYVAAIFHMITHAFFKALLFLGSGSVIHGMHHHQDMRHFGGLRKLMPVTSATFIVGWLAIAGVPPFSGFWSKDEILAYAYDDSKALWAVGLVTAVLTAFYMSRQVFMTFFGRYRYADALPEELQLTWNNRVREAEARVVEAEAGLASVKDEAVSSADKVEKAQEKLAQRETEMDDVDPSDDKAVEKAAKNLDKAREAVVKAQESAQESVAAIRPLQDKVETIRTEASIISVEAINGMSDETVLNDEELPASVRERREFQPRESPWQMTVPLGLLAIAAIGAGGMNLPFTKDLHFLGKWLEPSLFHNEAHLKLSGTELWVLAIIAVTGGLIGISMAVRIYLHEKTERATVELPILADAWKYDSAVTNFMGGPGRKFFDLVSWFDRTIVDGAVNGTGRLVRSVGGELRAMQSGLVRSYAALIAVGAVALIAWFLVRTTF